MVIDSMLTNQQRTQQLEEQLQQERTLNAVRQVMSENSDLSGSRAVPGEPPSSDPSEFGAGTGSVDDWTGVAGRAPPTPPIAPCCKLQQQSRASPCQAASSSLIMPSSSPSIPGLPPMGLQPGSGPRLVGFLLGPNVLGFRPRPPLPLGPLYQSRNVLRIWC